MQVEIWQLVVLFAFAFMFGHYGQKWAMRDELADQASNNFTSTLVLVDRILNAFTDYVGEGKVSDPLLESNPYFGYNVAEMTQVAKMLRERGNALNEPTNGDYTEFIEFMQAFELFNTAFENLEDQPSVEST